MGAVQSAAAVPDFTNRTPVLIASITPCAFALSASPFWAEPAKDCCSTGMADPLTRCASLGDDINSYAAPAGKCAGSPIQKNGNSARKASHAFTAISGPIPAGSPQLNAIGRFTLTSQQCAHRRAVAQDNRWNRTQVAGFAGPKTTLRGPLLPQALACGHIASTEPTSGRSHV